MSSSASDCLGPSTKLAPGGIAGQGPMKQRYVIWTVRSDSYEVLNARTSEKKGAIPWREAAVGSVTRSSAAAPTAASANTPATRVRMEGATRAGFYLRTP